MDTHVKDLIQKDYVRSGKSLGDFALDWMQTYDDVCYELVLVNATSRGARVRGTIIVNSYEKIGDVIRFYDIAGEYYTRVVDTQKEFFLLLAEIRDDISRRV